tara:strand:- start:2459 stop:2629 length:171 start_codon:yes stop_codon:yes gene_type:complete
MDTNNIKDVFVTSSVAATPVIVSSMDIVSDVLSITLLTCSIIYTVIRIYKEGVKEK